MVIGDSLHADELCHFSISSLGGGGGEGEALEDFWFPYSRKVTLHPKLGLFRDLYLAYFWFSF